MTLDLGAVRAALAAQIAEHTGLRALDAPRGQVNPPCVVILPGAGQLATYGATMDGATSVTLRVMIVVSDAAPTNQVQTYLDSLIGIGQGQPVSVIDAIAVDPTLNGTCSWAEPVSTGSYGHLSWASVDLFGATVNVSVGA